MTLANIAALNPNDWTGLATAIGSMIAAATGLVAAIGVLLAKIRVDRIDLATKAVVLTTQRVEEKTDKVVVDAEITAVKDALLKKIVQQ